MTILPGKVERPGQTSPGPERDRGAGPLGLSTVRAIDDDGLRTLAEIEADVIRFAMLVFGGNIKMTARKLGISRSTLYRKLEKMR